MYPYTPGSMDTAMICSDAAWPFDREGQKLYAHGKDREWDHSKVLIPSAGDFPVLCSY